MTKKSLFWAGTLLFAGLAVAAPKAYNVTLSQPMKAGSVQIPAGDYKLKIEGSNAVFTDTQTGKSLSVPVTTENNDKKYEVTMLNSSKQGDMQQINAIELGGSTMKVEFGK